MKLTILVYLCDVAYVIRNLQGQLFQHRMNCFGTRSIVSVILSNIIGSEALYFADFCISCGGSIYNNNEGGSGVFKGRRARHLPRAPPFWGPPLEVLRA